MIQDLTIGVPLPLMDCSTDTGWYEVIDACRINTGSYHSPSFYADSSMQAAVFMCDKGYNS